MKIRDVTEDGHYWYSLGDEGWEIVQISKGWANWPNGDSTRIEREDHDVIGPIPPPDDLAR